MFDYVVLPTPMPNHDCADAADQPGTSRRLLKLTEGRWRLHHLSYGSTGMRTDSTSEPAGTQGAGVALDGQPQKGQTWYQESQRKRPSHRASCDR